MQRLTSIHSNFIYPKTERTEMVINSWIDKQIVVYSYNGTLLNNEKKWTVDTHNIVDESQNNFAKWKKSEEKVYMLHSSFYLKV